MSTLSERLQALGVTIGTRNLPKPREKVHDSFPISSVLPGNWQHTPHGDVFTVETSYKADFQVGKVKLGSMGPLNLIAIYAGEPKVKEYSLEQFLFIDTETTGLVGGTGTYTFLIGAGRFENDLFRLVQFFLTNPSEEIAQLTAFEEFISPCEVVVSFNGKSFDLPLINTRYMINGWPSPLLHLPHLDLLHLARRLWKNRLPSCTFGNIEWNILGVKRSEQDVPGWMIADLYFDYLHTGDARPLRGVFYHNEIDVLSLASLLSYISNLVSSPLSNQIEHTQDLISIAKFYADLGFMDDAANIYQRALESETLSQNHYWETVCQLSLIQKKRGELETAKNLWMRAAGQHHLYAIEELAKLYEHGERDFTAALSWTENALRIINQGDTPLSIQLQWKDSLLHRKKRLLAKIDHIMKRNP
jgi:hypothetical protein